MVVYVGLPGTRGVAKKTSNTKLFRWGFFLSLFCGYISPMLGNLGSHMGWCQGTLGLTWAYMRGLGVQLGPMLGDLVVYVGLHRGLREEKNTPNTKLYHVWHGFEMFLNGFAMFWYPWPLALLNPWETWEVQRILATHHGPSFPIMFSNRSCPNLFYFSTGPTLV